MHFERFYIHLFVSRWCCCCKKIKQLKLKTGSCCTLLYINFLICSMKLTAKANTLSWFWAFPQHGTQCEITDMFPPVLSLMTIQPLKGKTVSVHSCTSTSGSQLSWDINILGHWVWVIWCSSSRVPGLPRDQGATGVVCFFHIVFSIGCLVGWCGLLLHSVEGYWILAGDWLW